MQKAFWFNGLTREELAPVGNLPTLVWAPQIAFNPGYYKYNEHTYDLTRPGLYMLTNTATPNTTRMVVNTGDVVALVSAASRMVAFGKGDAGLSLSQRLAKSRTSTLQLLCGDHCAWTSAAILGPCGVPHRRVHFLTMETPNNVVDGHEAIEVKIGADWAVCDVSLKTIFRTEAGGFIAAKALPEAIATGSAVRVETAEWSHAVEPATGFDATGYAMTHLQTEADRSAWHRRICQAVGLWSSGRLWWKLPPGAEHRKSWVLSLSPLYGVIDDPLQWNGLFYGNGHGI
jgi:hypothetical protein